MNKETRTSDAQLTESDTWALIVRVLPHDVPGSVRMRRWLKSALRGYGIKVLSIGSRLPDVKPLPVKPKRTKQPRRKRAATLVETVEPT